MIHTRRAGRVARLALLTLVIGAGVALAAPAAQAKNPCNPCAANPCAMKNPCNPCAAKNPCAMKNPCNPCAAKNPCAMKNPCNPCAAKNPCAMKNPCNPCGAANPCNPCGGNPCGGGGANAAAITQPSGVKIARSTRRLIARGKKLWNDKSLSSNGLACATCHVGGSQFNASFATPYPHRVAMPAQQAGVTQVSAAEMVQFCMLTPMAAQALPWDSVELAALTAYVGELQKTFVPAGHMPANPCNPCGANPCAARNPCKG